jgi:hypothetical protein
MLKSSLRKKFKNPGKNHTNSNGFLKFKNFPANYFSVRKIELKLYPLKLWLKGIIMGVEIVEISPGDGKYHKQFKELVKMQFN